jgi:hypothetical protein
MILVVVTVPWFEFSPQGLESNEQALPRPGKGTSKDYAKPNRSEYQNRFARPPASWAALLHQRDKAVGPHAAEILPVRG